MYNSEQRTRSRGLSLPWVLTIIFCVLRFVGVIDWPWYWLISPIWISVSIAIVLVGILIGINKIINE